MPVHSDFTTTGWAPQSTGTMIAPAFSVAASVGDIVVVCGSIAGNGSHIANLYDNLGNSYRLAAKSSDVDAQTGSTNLAIGVSGDNLRAFIAFSIISVPGTIQVTVIFNRADYAGIAQILYKNVPGFDFTQADYHIATRDCTIAPTWWIGPDPPSAEGGQTGLITWGNSIVISIAKASAQYQYVPTPNFMPGVFTNYAASSLNYIYWLTAYPDFYFPGNKTTSIVEYSPTLPAPASDFFEQAVDSLIGPYSDEQCVVVFSAPIAVTLLNPKPAVQSIFRGGKGPVGTIGPANTIIQADLPWMPQRDGMVLVLGLVNGNPSLADLTVSDAYGNTYTLCVASYDAGGATAAIWKTYAHNLPARGTFTVTMTWNNPNGINALQGPPCLALYERPGFNAVNVSAGIGTVQGGVPSPGFTTVNSTAPVVQQGSYMVGIAGARDNTYSGPAMTLSPSNGFTERASWKLPLRTFNVTNRSRVGVGVVADKYVTTTGSDFAQFVVSGASSACAMVSITGMVATCPVTANIPVGSAYSSPVTVVGGISPLSYTLISGSLPNGLSLNPTTGLISGTVTSSGTYSFVVRVTDSVGNFADTPGCPLTVYPYAATCPLSFAQLGVPYSSSVTVTGGISPFTFTITAGSLPPGLNLSSMTGLISGVPSAVGTYSYSVTVQDSVGNILTITCAITVATDCPPALTVEKLIVSMVPAKHLPVRGTT